MCSYVILEALNMKNKLLIIKEKSTIYKDYPLTPCREVTNKDCTKRFIGNCMLIYDLWG